MKYADMQKFRAARCVATGRRFVCMTGRLTLVFLLTGCQTNTFTHNHFPERVAGIHTVGLLPQIHTAILSTYRGYDPAPAPLPDEPQIRSELIASAVDQLQRRGFVVKEGLLPDSTNHTWNGRMIQRLAAPPKAANPDLKVLATNMNVDGLILLDATAYKSTPHRQNITMPENTLSVFLNVGLLASCAVGGGIPGGGGFPFRSWQGATTEITLVDGVTGEVLWATVDNFDNFETNKPAKAVEKLFNRYPKPKPSKRNAP
jgi:hypothetical protein